MSNNKTPFQIIKRQYVTEKSSVLMGLHESNSNKCVKRCENPKAVFIVDINANKRQIAQALEEIYAEKHIKVVAVNTITVKGKMRRVRGRRGRTAAFKKAVVTLEKGDSLE